MILMAWRIVVQPDGRYARFADPVDNFTHLNMTREEALEVCREYLGRIDSEEKVQRAEKEPGRWANELETIEVVHGRDARMEMEKLASTRN